MTIRCTPNLPAETVRAQGSGTEQSPYNLFEDALNAVEDGGTICVGEKAHL